MNRYRWVVFTSANGVLAVFRRLQAMGKDSRALAHTRIAAVGPGTAAALRERSVEPDLIPDAYLTEAVAEALIRQGVKDTHILLPRADIATELLAQRLTEAGALLTEVTAYRTVQAGELDPEVAQLLAAGQIDIVTFASASTVRNLVALLGGDTAALAHCRIASIGPVTTRSCPRRRPLRGHRSRRAHHPRPRRRHQGDMGEQPARTHRRPPFDKLSMSGLQQQ